jgi:hypothetical protein
MRLEEFAEIVKTISPSTLIAKLLPPIADGLLTFHTSGMLNVGPRMLELRDLAALPSQPLHRAAADINAVNNAIRQSTADMVVAARATWELMS